jgi:ATP-dependent protease HslVU (ClpYQ) peptidase subunit
MTTIVFDGKTLAVDSQVTSGSVIVGVRNKIQDIGGYFVAGCGNTDGIDLVVGYLLKGKERPSGLSASDADVLFVNKETGEAFRAFGDTLVMSKAVIPFFGGSGAEIAQGAYQLCKDPVKALKVAMKLDVFTGGPINTITIQKPA